jgi:regulator of replication initiation timing
MNGFEILDKHAESILKNYTIDDLIKRYTQLLVRNEELQKENRELRRQLENKELSETNPKPLLPDYEEVQDNNGRVWYKRTHFNAQRKESRQIEKYDVIITKRDLDEPVPYILFVDSFDFESDFAARCLYGKSVYYNDSEMKKHSETWYGNFAPGFKYFSFATHEEIEELFDKINESLYLYEKCITNKEIKERYSEYLD